MSANNDSKVCKTFNVIEKQFTPLLHKLVNRYPPPPTGSREDVFAAARFGLYLASTRYDLARSKAITFFTKTVDGEIKRYYRDHGWDWKVSRRLKEAVSAARDKEDLALEPIATKYNTTIDEIKHIRRLLAPNISHESFTTGERHDFGFKAKVHAEHLANAMLRGLNPIERQIVIYSYIEERTLIDIADICAMDSMAVRKIKEEAVEKLREKYLDTDRLDIEEMLDD